MQACHLCESGLFYSIYHNKGLFVKSKYGAEEQNGLLESETHISGT